MAHLGKFCDTGTLRVKELIRERTHTILEIEEVHESGHRGHRRTHAAGALGAGCLT